MQQITQRWNVFFSKKNRVKAHIVTIPNPGKDPSTPQNFHPISLLKVDVKMAAKLIAHHLLRIIPSLIKPDQSGFTIQKSIVRSNHTHNKCHPSHQTCSITLPTIIHQCCESIQLRPLVLHVPHPD